MSANLSCTPPAPESELALDNATVPAWTRRPVDAVDRWKAPVRASRPRDERERARPDPPSLDLCGYDPAWPIVLFEGQILDGRARAELALELWRETGRDDVIPSFVELVPNDPDQADEAALLYLQQRLVATRSFTEGERVAAAFRLFQLYRESRARRPALALEGHGRFASRSASARVAAAVAGVSPRTIERYAFVEKHGPEALAPAEAQALLGAVETGEVSLRAAERQVKAALAKREAESQPKPPRVLASDLDPAVPKPAGEIAFAAPVTLGPETL